MKRTAEFVLGLIGSIWAILIAIGTIFISGFAPVTNELAGTAMITNSIGLISAICAVIFACLVNSKTKVSGIIMTVCGIVVFLTNFIQIIPAILLIIAGVMCLTRKI
ncbi:DUF4064 domain-containing protein [Thomasclavelia cocleata]|uniref:DUF4064 domain-containing protein n=1 Tax=Thomasclavelia cocleata TaxID=69824 RepID=UPI0024945281|nr:DUF4064 domain-containing protein [Thomasclavelia cocleata]